MDKCDNCGTPLVGLQTRFCCRDCNQAFKNRAKRLALEASIPTLTCSWCASSFMGRVKTGLQSSYCGDQCRRLAANERNKSNGKRRRAELRELDTCANPFCGKWFSAPRGSNKQTCSKDCMYVVQEGRKDGVGALHSAAIHRGMLNATRVYFRNCKTCGELVCTRQRMRGNSLCDDCRAKWLRAHNAHKNHSRRAAGPKVMSVHQIAERDGRKCCICHRIVDMALSGRAKWGPTIEHLIPVSRGGTNDPDNLALAHRHCNTSRGNRGHAQLLLSA